MRILETTELQVKSLSESRSLVLYRLRFYLIVGEIFPLFKFFLILSSQFMTLPGIDRRVAQSIVDHRAAIGGRFQRTDDLALVSGIGAERLEQIRPEICIKRSTRSNQG